MKSGSLAWAVLLIVLAFAGLLALGLLLPEGSDRLDLGGQAVGVLEVSGVIDDPAETLRDLESLRRERRVKALVVRVDSPGGEVAASQEIHAALLRYRKETAQPVVASLGGIAGSGGYYIACAADRIVANPGPSPARSGSFSLTRTRRGSWNGSGSGSDLSRAGR